MRTAVVFTFLALSVLSDRTKSSAGTTPVTPRKQGEISYDNDRLFFGNYFVNLGNLAVTDFSCSTPDLPSFRPWEASHSPCLQGYARHSNGRCYRIVDKSQDGGDASKREYRVTYSEDCENFREKTVSDLSRFETLDFCDEYGGCDSEDDSGGATSTGCVEGYISDANGNCIKLLQRKDKTF